MNTRPMICCVSSNHRQRQNLRMFASLWCYLCWLILNCNEWEFGGEVFFGIDWFQWKSQANFEVSRQFYSLGDNDVWKGFSLMVFVELIYFDSRWKRVFGMIVLELVGWREKLEWSLEIGGKFGVFWFFWKRENGVNAAHCIS